MIVMAKDEGYVQIYTGNGKGKTTAAIGLAVRALGAGHRVMMIQFMKDPVYSEHKLLKTLGGFTLKTFGKPFFVVTDKEKLEEAKKWSRKVVVFEKGNPPADYVELIREGLAFAKEAASNGEYDLVILDEINVVLYYDLASVGEVMEILDSKAANTEIVLTGRYADEKLVERADLVTEMKEIKHYYRKGVPSRKGIEE